LEVQQGFAVGRKQLRELRERVAEELLPRAFPTRRVTWAWIDPQGGWLFVNASSPAKGEELVETLRKSADGFVARPLEVNLSPGAAMTDWVAGSEPPAGFTIDQDLELKAIGESRAAVRYVHHALEGDDIRAHIAGGKMVTQLGLTWNDRVSFVLTEQMQVKRLQFLDVLREQAESEAESAEEMFEIEFVLMTGEIVRLVGDLVGALDGERVRD
jgi:recombination associated protein RdgC